MAISIGSAQQKPHGKKWDRCLSEIEFPGNREEALRVIEAYLIQSFVRWNPRAKDPNEKNDSKATNYSKAYENRKRRERNEKALQFQIREEFVDGQPVQILYGDSSSEARTKLAATALARVAKGLPAYGEDPVKPLRYRWTAWTEDEGEPYVLRTNYSYPEELLAAMDWQDESLFRETTHYLCRGLTEGRDGKIIPEFFGERHYEYVFTELPQCLSSVGEPSAETEELRKQGHKDVERKIDDALTAPLGALAAKLMELAGKSATSPIVVTLYKRGTAFASKVWPDKPVQEYGEEKKARPARPIDVEPLQKALLCAQRPYEAKRAKLQAFSSDLEKAARKLGELLKDSASSTAVRQLLDGSLSSADFMLLEQVQSLPTYRKVCKAMGEWDDAYGKLSKTLEEIPSAASNYKEAKRKLQEALKSNARLQGIESEEDPSDEVEGSLPVQELPSLRNKLAQYLGTAVLLDAETQVSDARDRMLIEMYAFWQGIIDLIPLSGSFQSELSAMEELIRKHDDGGDFGAFYDALYAPEAVLQALTDLEVEKAKAVYDLYENIAVAVTAYNDAVTVLNGDA